MEEPAGMGNQSGGAARVNGGLTVFFGLTQEADTEAAVNSSIRRVCGTDATDGCAVIGDRDEYDLDDLISKRPNLVYMKDPWKENTAGSRHRLRYQDIKEMISLGINVFTAVDIGALESHAGLARKITGSSARGTVPDSFIENARRIVVVDDGDDGNISSSLRTIALRYLSVIEEKRLASHNEQLSIQGAWRSGEKLMVAVSPSPYSEYLIRWTRRIAFNARLPWVALFIERGKRRSGEEERKLRENLSLAGDLGAEVVSTVDDDVVSGLLKVAQRENVTQIIVGKPLSRTPFEYIRGNIVERLLGRCGDIEIHVVTPPVIKRGRGIFRLAVIHSSSIKEYLYAVVAVAGVTALNALVSPVAGYWTTALLYLLCVSFIALIVGRGPVLLSAFLSALTWNFMFIPPVYTLRIGLVQDAVMFGTYFVIALILGSLTAKLRKQETILTMREKRISDLYELSQLLENASGQNDIARVSNEYIRTHLDSGSVLHVVDGNGMLHMMSGGSAGDDVPSDVINWVFRNRRPAGMFTSTFPDIPSYILPLQTRSEISGVMVITPSGGFPLTPDTEDFIRNIVIQIAAVIERDRLAEAQRSSMFVAESERLHRILLNTISHELRTPLTAITGASSCLLDEAIASKADVRRELYGEIRKASDRLNHLVDNLLDMSRLETGALKLNNRKHDIHDLVSVSLRRLADDLRGRTVTVSISDEIPLVMIDFALMEQVITNLIYNASLYTPEGSRIEIGASVSDDLLSITVRDHGTGIDPADLPFIFEKFRRGSGARSGGTGLGLSICKGIVEAHGGIIRAENAPDGGAIFTIEMPTAIPERG